MQSTNFDNTLKERLEERTLAPTSKSWEQLRSKLDKKDKNAKPIFWWLGIAASFLGGILLMTFFFNSERATTDSIVNQEILNPKNSENKFNPIVELIPIENQKEQISRPSQIMETQKEKTTQKPKTNQSLAQQDKTDVFENDSSKKIETVTEELNFEEKVIDEIIANFNPEKEATDDEIDALLNEAFAKISKQTVQSNPVITSSSLLEDVEGEIEESFRERIFQMLKEGLKISREAVANRNQ